MRRALWIVAWAGAVVVASSLAQGATCRSEIGSAKANVLVERCKEVSPATRPPCNADNPCALIVGEIRRGCAMMKGDADAPAYCGAGEE